MAQNYFLIFKFIISFCTLLRFDLYIIDLVKLAKKKIFAEDIAQALNMNIDFLEDLVAMEVSRRLKVLSVIEESSLS